MRDYRSSHRCVARIVLALALTAGVGACKTADNTAAKATPTARALAARLAPIGGSVARGSVTFRSYEGGVTVVANFGGVAAGTYRVAIHKGTNCTSPNGFSAGDPMLLPGSSLPVAVSVRTEGSEGTVAAVMRIPGLAIDGPAGIDGKLVIVHEGFAGSLEARPGIPNGRVACGVIGPVTVLFSTVLF